MTHYAVRAVSYSPAVVERIVRLIPSDRISVPTGPGRFSPKEVLAHMADWEPVALGRIRAAVENNGSQIENWDEDQMAIDHDYASCDLGEQLALYRERRAATVEYVKTIPEDKWGNSVVHSAWGAMTVDDLVNLLVQHDMYHLEQLCSVS